MKKRTQASMPVLMIIFLAGCVVCNIIGNIISSTPIEPTNHLAGFLFYTVPVFLGRTVGLNTSGGGNSLLFSLVSSLFLLVMSVKLYTADSGTEISDFAPKPESAVARLIHFILSFFCLERIAYVMLDSAYYKEASVFVLVVFLAYVIIGLITNREEEETCGQKFACRILSTFGLIMGIAGMSNVLWYSNLAKLIVIPSAVAQWMERIAVNSNPAGGSMLIMLLITSVLATIGIVFAAKTFANGITLPFTGSAAVLFILGGYWHYSGNPDTHISLQAVAYWVLLLIILVIWAIASERKIPVFLCGIGAICGLGSCVQAIRIFAKPCNAALERLGQQLIPMQEKAFTWATELVKNDFLAGVLICVVGIGVFLLLTIPASRASDKLAITPDIMLTASKFFLGIVVVRFMDKSFLPWDLNNACYYFLMITASVIVVSLLAYAVKLDLRGLIHSIVILLLTAAMGAYFAIFAPVVGLIAFALFTALSTFATIASLRHYKTTQQQRQQAYNNANEALDNLQELGVDSRDISRARISLDFHFGKK